jgi:predicted transcriptional regulator YdeE
MNAHQTLKTTELQIVERPAMSLVGLVKRSTPGSSELPQLWEKFGPRMASIPQQVNPAVSYGVCRDMDMQTNEFDYLAAVETEAGAPVPEGMVRWEVAGGLFALIPATLTTIGDAYGLSETLIPQAGYRRSAGFDYELYDERFDPADPDAVLYICIPVEKA